jgi:crotonobetainyl-CoA:carnitine CoA-transferase CaiB-like acyl-CoA transferase
VSPPTPLAGIRVIEFSHVIMGPSCGLILGDLGADVIKVEPVPDGDNTRRLRGSGVGFFVTFNRNKRSIALDLDKEAGRSIAEKLIESADVVIENFRTGMLERFGLGYQAAVKKNPGIIYCSLKGFLSGPYEQRTALDEVVQMMGGLAYMTGPQGRPIRAGASVNDIMGGMFAVIGILAALRERAITGLGQVVKSALFENNVYLMGTHMAQYAITGEIPEPMPSRQFVWPVYDVFETEDSQIFIGVITDTHWQAFCGMFDLSDLASNPTLNSNRSRVAAREQFMPRLRRLFRALPQQEVVDRCERANLPFAPIMRPDQLYDDPQLNSPGAMLNVTLPEGREIRVPALPIEMNNERPGKWRDVPDIGEHSAEIAAELGYSEAEIADLKNSGLLFGR